jgi:glycerol-3-phosphate dehydrogenase
MAGSLEGHGVIERDLPRMARERFDLVVVGGGVYGAALLLAASHRGLRAALVEQADFGSGTSWNSLRILHGGLRYLQTADVGRFVQSVRERRRMARWFPDLVAPLRCVMPLYRAGMKRRSVMRVALALNDLASAHRNSGVREDLHIPRGSTLGPAQMLALCPAIRRERLEGAAVWTDYRMLSSERILIEMLRWAVDEGASAANYVTASGLSVGDGRVTGLDVRDAGTSDVLRIAAPVVVNCTGTAGLLTGLWDPPRARLVQPPSLAFNLLINRALPCAEGLGVGPPGAGSPVLFAVPQGDTTLVGTAHLARPPGTHEAHPTEAEIAQFIRQLSEGLPGWGVRIEDVSRVFAGLLPAVSPGSAQLSKREVIVDHGRMGGPDGLFTVSGVKFTTAYDVAVRLLQTAGRLLPAASPHSLMSRPRAPAAATPTLISASLPSAALARSQLIDCARQESVRELDDLLLRRTNWGTRVVDLDLLRHGYRGLLSP